MIWKAPIVFAPLYKEKVWGGRRFESVYGRALPNGANYGESWELVDREDAQAAVAKGPLAGQTLHDLWIKERTSLFGPGHANHPASRFPLLVKILDASDDLSIQVHPPAEVAPRLQGEPKTEMWYVAHAEPGAKLYVGLRRGVTREQFEQGIREGRTQEQVHCLTPRAGEFIFIPSGRLHAIGSGLLIYEIQQNSDTTYRVFDWNRPGIDGNPRDLHVEESLACIDFDDVEPSMSAPVEGDLLVDCEYFQVRQRQWSSPNTLPVASEGDAAVVTVIRGEVHCGPELFRPGDFFLVPAQAEDDVRNLRSGTDCSEVLLTTIPAIEQEC